MTRSKVNKGVRSVGKAFGDTFKVASKGLTKSTKLIGLNAMSRQGKKDKVVKGAVLGGIVGLAVGMPFAGALVGGVYEHDKNKRR